MEKNTVLSSFEFQMLDYRLPATDKILSVDDLGDFYRTCFISEYSQYFDDASMKHVIRWLDGPVVSDIVAIQYPDTKMLACMKDTDPVGTAVYAERQQSVYVWGLYIHPKCLRCGIATLLMERVALAVSEQSRIEVVVLEASVKAMAFYKDLGFKTCKSEVMEVFPNLNLNTNVMQCPSAFLLKKLANDRNGIKTAMTW